MKWGKTGCVLLLALVWTAGCSSEEQRLAEHRAAAQELSAAGSLREALIELQTALQIDPTSAEINFEIAELWFRGRSVEDALFYYREARRLDPSMSAAALAEARLTLAEDVDEAKQLIQEVLERDPASVSARVLLSQAALVSKDLDSALAEALIATEIDANDPEGLLQLGIVYNAQIREAMTGKETPDPSTWENALAAFERAAAADEATAPSRHALRAAIERASLLGAWEARRSEAAEAFEEAYRKVEGWPDWDRTEMLQSVLDSAQRYSRGIRDTATEIWAIERSLELEPKAIRQWKRLALLVDGYTGEPSTVLARMAETLPDLAVAQIAYARDLAQRGHREMALAHLSEALPKVTAPERLLGEMLGQQILAGDPSAAKELSERLVREYPDSPEALRGQARIAEFEGRDEDAVELYRTLIQRNEHPNDLFRLSSAEARLYQLRPALEYIDRALALAGPGTPFHLICLRQKAKIQTRLGDHAGALVTFRRVFRRLRGQIPPSDLLPAIRAAYGAGRPEAARQMLERLFELDEPPIDAALLFALNERERQPALARQRLDAALEQHPDDVRLIRMAGGLDWAEGNGDRATERLAEAVKARPDSGILHRLLARQLARAGDPEAALSHAEQALKLEPEQPGNVVLLVRLLTRLGRQSEVLERLTAQEEAGTLEAPGRIVLARLHSSRGERKLAIELLEAALAERSDLPGAKNDLAYHLTYMGGNLDRALTLAQEARQALPKSAGVADTLGFVYLKRNIPEAAAAQFEEAIELTEEQSRQWAIAQHHLGQALRAMGRTEDAVAAFELALAAAVEYPEADETRQAIKELSQTEG